MTQTTSPSLVNKAEKPSQFMQLAHSTIAHAITSITAEAKDRFANEPDFYNSYADNKLRCALSYLKWAQAELDASVKNL